MATLYIRNVPDALYHRLKERAKLNRRSIAQEVVTLIEDTVDKGKKPTDIWGAMDALRQRIRARYGLFEDSSALIREDRER